MMPPHTKTPWKAELSTIYTDRLEDYNELTEDSDDDIVGSTIDRKDAAFICLAVNNHEKLVEALKETKDAAAHMAKIIVDNRLTRYLSNDYHGFGKRANDLLDSLSSAEEGKTFTKDSCHHKIKWTSQWEGVCMLCGIQMSETACKIPKALGPDSSELTE